MDCGVIIIDDNDDLVKTYSEILTNEGIKVLGTGNNGKIAVELYKKIQTMHNYFRYENAKNLMVIMQ